MDSTLSRTTPLLAAALDYAGRGWSIIPTHRASKLPATKWKRYQDERAAEPQLLKWFNGDNDYGIAVVFGEVSGGLASRDFDDVDAYHEWASNHPDLARTLPTVATSRGRHVYFIAPPGSVQAVRNKTGKPIGRGAIALADGELRCGVGCYSALPPSVHPSGHVYRWLVPLPDGELPIVDLLESGFIPPGYTVGHSEHSRHSRTQNTQRCVAQAADTVAEAVELAIERTLPSGTGQRCKCLFRFARHLKAIPALANAEAGELEPHVKEWHRRALPKIATKPWYESWFAFLAAWSNVKYPAGMEPIAVALKRAVERGAPDVARELDHPALQLLVGLCAELQREAGDEPFYLSCRAAHELLGVSFPTAAKWLNGLRRVGILSLVERGGLITHKASEYRYLAPL